MAGSLLQSNSQGNQFGGNPWTLAFTGNTLAGSLLVVAIMVVKSTGTLAISSVADTQVNSYTMLTLESVTSPHEGQIAVLIAYAFNTKGGANTITVTANATPNTNLMAVLEFGGMQTSADPKDQTANNTGVSTNPSAGSVTTNAAGEAAVAVCISDDGSGSTAPTAGSGWTALGGFAGGSVCGVAEWTIQLSAGSLTGNFVHATGTWVATMATFFASGDIVTITKRLNMVIH